MMTHVGATGSGSGHGGAMAGSMELSARVAEAARGEERAQGGGQKAGELIERLTEGSVGAGTAGGQRIDDEDLRAPRLKKTSGTMLWCFHGCLAWRG